ncbi:GLABROUS1 enhancer-binding protein family [Arabidopsis suecica]|uniref:GLABROUS1 enhancer-binding protein family n=1 Tax=Arabidopsis suecica TaxID=45249 RepID=A0A8T2BEW8_ARASU|nr:GLABROUS1 enhancer-binding protein family [Arabidopsis suecica]
MASASEEEEESGSTEKGSGSSGEESDSSDGFVSKKEAHSKKPVVQTSVVNQPSGSKTTTKPSHVGTKRVSEKTDEGSKKKMKMSEDDVKNDEKPKQNLFARKFSKEDEVIILQRIIDFNTRSGYPSDAFYEDVKKSISFDASTDQLVTKIRNLRRKFDEKILKSLEKGKTEELIFSSEAFDQRCFDLSRKIWGSNGFLSSKSKTMLQGQQLGGKVKKDDEDEDREKHVISSPLSYGQELVSFITVENPTMLGMDEAKWIANWDKVKDGPEKRELEFILKKLQAKQVELVMMRIGFINDAAAVLFKQDKASSSGK